MLIVYLTRLKIVDKAMGKAQKYRSVETQTDLTPEDMIK